MKKAGLQEKAFCCWHRLPGLLDGNRTLTRDQMIRIRNFIPDQNAEKKGDIQTIPAAIHRCSVLAHGGRIMVLIRKSFGDGSVIIGFFGLDPDMTVSAETQHQRGG